MRLPDPRLLVGECPECHRQIAVTNDRRMHKHGRPTPCKGWGAFAVKHPTQPAVEGDTPTE